MTLKRPSILPGFGLTFGYSVLYLSLIVLLPLAALCAKAASLSLPQFWNAATEPRVLAAFRLTFSSAAIAAAVNAVAGCAIAWALVRYTFPGKRLVNSLVDLPFALPTAVSGIALTAIYSNNGWLGQPLDRLGIKAVFTPLGIVLALVFVGLPFVVRTVQPALEELDAGIEEAAATLGANRAQTLLQVLLPPLIPAVLTGFASAFARALGEYGSIVFISGNMPMKTEVTSLLIVAKLEQYDYAGATAIAVMMLAASLAVLVGINFVERRVSARYRAEAA